VRKADKTFWTWFLKWTGRYICPEYGLGVEKFSQAKRVKDDALERIPNLREMRAYIRKHHPGFSRGRRAA